MELQNFEMEYLHNKDLSYFEDYNTNYKLTPHVYVAEGLEEIQEILQEVNIPAAMVYNTQRQTKWKGKRNFMFYLQLKKKCSKNHLPLIS